MINQGFVMAGNPDDCAKCWIQGQRCGPAIIHMQMGGMPHDRIMESIELIGKS